MNWTGAFSMSKCLHGMVWVSIQEHNSPATVCHVSHHGLILFGILKGAPLFLRDAISRWPGLLDPGSNSSPEVLDYFCISCSDFWRNLSEYYMAEMLAAVRGKRTSQHCWGCWRKLDNLVFSVSIPKFSSRNCPWWFTRQTVALLLCYWILTHTMQGHRSSTLHCLSSATVTRLTTSAKNYQRTFTSWVHVRSC